MFLEKNLEALNTKPHHFRLVTRLRNYTPKTDAFPVAETYAGDYTILVNNMPIHSPHGAMREATELANQEVQTKRYGQNLIFGLGLGYVLKAVVDLKTRLDLESRVVVYEPDMDLLHFVMTNVDLSDLLAHPHVQLAENAPHFFQTVNSNYVQGDGFGLLYTPGYVSAYPDSFKDIVGRLKRNTESANRNTQLLRLRAKDWAVNFFHDLPYVPQCRPVDHWSQAFAGKPVVIIGSGPSLGDSLEALHALKDRVVTIAVGGAMRALKQANFTPDFVFFMDYIGPKRHLHGLEEPLQGAHILTGPSAENVIFDQPARSWWMTRLFFNEQFSETLDVAYGKPGVRFHTGGTVSMLAYHVAVEMGCRTFILVGQDLALRGDKLYADGTTVDLDAHNVLRVEETDTSTARCLLVEDVPGWNGETLKSPEDYSYFRLHFEGIVPLLKELDSNVQVYNCSVGGAYLKGYEHLPLSALIERLPQEPIDKEAAFQNALASSEPFDADEVAQRVYDHLANLTHEMTTCLKLARQCKTSLDHIMELSYDDWYEPTNAYSAVFNDLSERLEEDNFLKYTLFHEQWTLYHMHNDDAESYEEHLANFRLDYAYMESLITAFDQMLLPAAHGALQKLEERYPAIKPDKALSKVKAGRSHLRVVR